MKPRKAYLLAGEYFQVYREFYDVCCQSKDMAAFPVLQSLLEPPTLKSDYRLECLSRHLCFLRRSEEDSSTNL